MKKLLAAAVLGGALLSGLGAAPAQADTTTDQAFLLTLKMYRVPTDDMSNRELLAEGQAVCAYLQQPHTFFAEAGLQLMHMHPSWGVDDAAHFAGAATGAWCPDLGPSADSTETTTEPPTTSAPLSTTSQRQASLPGTDAQGFVDYPGARCDPGSSPAVLGRTTRSVLVVCQIGPANYYYRGLRLSDSESIELANAVRSSHGFDVTNPVDGTRYQIRPSDISITSPGGQVSSEPMIQYAAS
jgi:Protein of unknown function (DUF732)